MSAVYELEPPLGPQPPPSWLEVVVVAIIVFVMVLLLFDRPVNGAADRDMVVICPVRLVGTTKCVANATTVYFNGDWRGVKLCRARKCWDYSELFPEGGL